MLLPTAWCEGRHEVSHGILSFLLGLFVKRSLNAFIAEDKVEVFGCLKNLECEPFVS